MSFEEEREYDVKDGGFKAITELPESNEQMDEAPKPKRPRSPNKSKAQAAGANGQAKTEVATYYLMDQSSGSYKVIAPEDLNKITAAIFGDDSKYIVQAKVLTVSVVVNGAA